MLQHNESKALEHPAYEEEAAKLADVLRHIEDRHRELKDQIATAADQQTADAIQKILQNNADTLYRALDQPYFGRIDYFRKDGESPASEPISADTPLQTIYLGGAAIPDQDVFSWTAPVARLWYTQSYEDGYTAPRGYIPTRVDLKRYIRIRSRHLEDLNDMFQRQIPAATGDGQDVLRRALSGVGRDDGHLQVIVETIEPDQYENIANVSDKVLIVQGAAGSGKSEIGLHRIAYLLSPHSDIAERERPTPDTTLFVGPSQAFLEYASDILPTLGVRKKIDQVKFSDWINGRLSARTSINPRIWNDLLKGSEMRRFDERVETFKGSLAMADIIERHVADLANQVRRRCEELPTTIPGIDSLRMTKDQIKSAVNKTLPTSERGRRVNRRRQDFINQVMLLIRSEVRGRRPIGRDVLLIQLNAVAAWCAEAWEPIDFRGEYVGLLSDPERMMQLSRSDMQRGLADDLAKSVDRMHRMRPQRFDDSDLGALAYLDHLLNDTVESKYRHIVVDEAQDISPIEFKLLAASSTNNWFTVLGDTAQRLTPYRGVRGWRDLERVFGRSEIEVQHARTSYRASRRITEYNNRILRTFDKNIAAPKPFDREGSRVEYNRHKNTDEMYRGVIDNIRRIRSLDGMENAVTAILTRDQANLNRFQGFCEGAGIKEIALVGQEHDTNSRTFLGRIHDVKGLEYDAVIVMGVNESFSDTLFNKKLLYLATTRAKHYLSIHWSGRPSPILKSISNRGIYWHRR